MPSRIKLHQRYTALLKIGVWLVLSIATILLATRSMGVAVTPGIPETDWSRQAIARFHDLFNREEYEQLYSEYDAEYRGEISLQRHLAMFRSARNSLGRFVSATAFNAAFVTRHGENVLIVTDLATFQGGRTIQEEFTFRAGSPVGHLLAYRF
jgi:hypothetical protein